MQDFFAVIKICKEEKSSFKHVYVIFPSFIILLDESDSVTTATVARSNKKESGWIFLFWFHISEHKMI